MKKQMKKIVSVVLIMLLMAGTVLMIPLHARASSDTETAQDEKKTTEDAKEAVAASNLPSNGIDVVMVVDNSRSIWTQQAIRNEALRSVGHLSVGGDINLGCVYFADELYGSKLALTSMQNAEKAKKVLTESFNMTEQNEGNRDTNIGVGLKEAKKMLLEHQDGSRKKAIILFSDGINENFQQEQTYKAKADELTKNQVADLKEAGVEIYCVFLEKDRNDEETLKDIVNYYGEEDYAKDRFKKVKEDEIDTLSDEFAKIFYAVQNGMKYGSIDLSAGGKTSFYVPSMGVSKLQIYLKNDKDFEAELKCLEEEDDSKKEIWNDGLNVFITVENPTPGKWELTVTGKDKENTTGTIAYYTDFKCRTEVVNTDGSGKVFKNSKVKIKADFYDADNQVIKIDQAAELTAAYTFVDESGNTDTKYFPLTITENGAESGEFTMDSYGRYLVATRVVYDEFIDLSYPMPEAGEVASQDFIIYNKSGDFDGTKTDGGFQFSMKASDLVVDPEGEEISIVSVSQGNPENEVEAELKDGYFIVTAKKADDVKFTLNIVDETGKEGSVTIDGKVKDKQLMMIIQTAGMFALVILLGMMLLNKVKKSRLKKQVEETADKVLKKCTAAEKRFEIFDREKVEECISEFAEMQTDIELLQEEEDVLAAFGLDQYVTDDAKTAFAAPMEELLIGVDKMNKTVYEMADKAQDINYKGSVSYLKEKLEELFEADEELDGILMKLNDDCEGYPSLLASMEEALDEMTDKIIDFKDMLEEEITCDLKMKTPDGGYIGKKSAKNLTGYYRLAEDVKLISMSQSMETLRSLVGAQVPDIIVHSYAGEEEYEEGLTFRSKTPFEIKEAASGDGGERVASYDLFKGREYKLMIRGYGYIGISVN